MINLHESYVADLVFLRSLDLQSDVRAQQFIKSRVERKTGVSQMVVFPQT